MPLRKYKTMQLVDFNNAKHQLIYAKSDGTRVTKVGTVDDLNDKLAIPDNPVTHVFHDISHGRFTPTAYDTLTGDHLDIDFATYVPIPQLQQQLIQVHPEWFFTVTGNFRAIVSYNIVPRIVSWLVGQIARQWLATNQAIDDETLVQEFFNRYPYLEDASYNMVNDMANLVRAHEAIRINKHAWGRVNTTSYAAQLNAKLAELSKMAAQDPLVNDVFKACRDKLAKL